MKLRILINTRMNHIPKITDPIPTGTWTLYFHQADAERWTIDTFIKVHTCLTWGDVLVAIEEIGQTRFKNGLPFFMRGDILPLWENHQNIRGGSYSVRGGADTGIEIYKHYVISSMLNMSVESADDTIVGISVSPKIMNGPNNTSKIGFYVIKIWNKDSSKFNRPASLNLVHPKLVPSDIMYTPHTDKKM